MTKALLNKGVQKNDKNIKDIIETISKYEYEFYESIQEANKYSK